VGGDVAFKRRGAVPNPCRMRVDGLAFQGCRATSDRERRDTGSVVDCLSRGGEARVVVRSSRLLFGPRWMVVEAIAKLAPCLEDASKAALTSRGGVC
jgi:hypothetical protein